MAKDNEASGRSATGMHASCTVTSAVIRGVEAIPVFVEVSVAPGLPSFSIVGMADASVQESRERVRAALRSCGFTVPQQRIVVNLAPAGIRKTGAGFDLPIAIGILCATGQIDRALAEDALMVGELSLTGEARPVAGTLAYAVCARNLDLRLASAPGGGAAVPVEGLERLCVRHLSDFRSGSLTAYAPGIEASRRGQLPDYADIPGNVAAKRALQIAAAGGHGVLLTGPADSSAIALALRLPSIMPPLSEAEKMDAAIIHDVNGLPLDLIERGVRPCRRPHCTTSLPGLLGGGSPLRPGEASLAHNGVLVLEDVHDFDKRVLQALRQPHGSGEVVIARADGNVRMPTRFLLAATSLPCPCGHFGDKDEPCTCQTGQIETFRRRAIGPLVDRIEVFANVDASIQGARKSSEDMKSGVLAAQEFAQWRFSKEGAPGRPLSASDLIEACGLSDEVDTYLQSIIQTSCMRGRSLMRMLAVARTVADMEQAERVEGLHLQEALALTQDR